MAGCGGSSRGQEEREIEENAVAWLKDMNASNIKAACRLMTAFNHHPFPGHPNWSPAKNCAENWLHSDNTPVEWKPKKGVISVWGEPTQRCVAYRSKGIAPFSPSQGLLAEAVLCDYIRSTAAGSS
jgi:hypothetical protein